MFFADKFDVFGEEVRCFLTSSTGLSVIEGYRDAEYDVSRGDKLAIRGLVWSNFLKSVAKILCYGSFDLSILSDLKNRYLRHTCAILAP